MLRFVSLTCDCGGKTPIAPEDPLDPAEAAPEAESLALDAPFMLTCMILI